jgi:hypothetical protein
VPRAAIAAGLGSQVEHLWYLEGMQTPEQSPTTVIYRSGTSEALGAGWDVMHVVYQRKYHGVMHTANSVIVARDANGTIIRKIDIDQWVLVRDEETLRAYRECWDRLAEEAAGAGRKIEEE